ARVPRRRGAPERQHGAGAERDDEEQRTEVAALARPDRRRIGAVAVRVDELGGETLGVEAEMLGVLFYERATEDAAGQDLESILLERLQETDADLRRVRDLAQTDAAQLTFSSQRLTE